MPTTQLAVVAAEGNVFAGDVDMILAPGADGQLGILPRHAPLLTLLMPGLLHIRQGESERLLAVGGGFLDAEQTRVTALVDSAEWSDEIDLQRAQDAASRARQRLGKQHPGTDLTRAEAALRRSLARIKTISTAQELGLNDSNRS